MDLWVYGFIDIMDLMDPMDLADLVVLWILKNSRPEANLHRPYQDDSNAGTFIPIVSRNGMAVHQVSQTFNIYSSQQTWFSID